MNNFFTIIFVLMLMIVSSCAKNEDNHEYMDSSYNDKENIDMQLKSTGFKSFSPEEMVKALILSTQGMWKQ